MGITVNGNQQTSSTVMQPSELLGRRYVVPNDYTPRVLSDIAKERLDSRGRVQYITRTIANSESSWRDRQKQEARDKIAKRKRRGPS